jgi:hypothetical protein
LFFAIIASGPEGKSSDGEIFSRTNFAELNVFYRELRIEQIEKVVAYQFTALISKPFEEPQ